MAFGRRSNETVGGGDDSAQDLPPHITRIIRAMDRIFAQAASLSAQVRAGSPLVMPGPGDVGPIDLTDYAKLFERINGEGAVLFSTYYFTQDVKSLDPDAHYQLSLIHQKATMLNLMLTGGTHAGDSALAPLLDAVLVKSAYFGSIFKGYNIVTGILSRSLDSAALNLAMDRQRARWEAAMTRARAEMLNPAMLRAHAPTPEPMLILSAEGPYQDGQRVIDGVVFSPDMAKVLLARMAAMQAAAMAPRVAS